MARPVRGYGWTETADEEAARRRAAFAPAESARPMRGWVVHSQGGKIHVWAPSGEFTMVSLCGGIEAEAKAIKLEISTLPRENACSRCAILQSVPPS